MANNTVIHSKGSRLYVIDVESNEIFKVNGVSSIGVAESPRDVTSFQTLEAGIVSYVQGVIQPSTTSFTLNYNPVDETHQAIYELSDSGREVTFVVAMSDGAGAPTLTDGALELDPSTSYRVHDGFVTSFPQGFEANTIVTIPVAVQGTSKVVTVPRAV